MNYLLFPKGTVRRGSGYSLFLKCPPQLSHILFFKTQLSQVIYSRNYSAVPQNYVTVMYFSLILLFYLMNEFHQLKFYKAVIYVRGLSVQNPLFWHFLYFIIDIKYAGSPYSWLDYKLGRKVLLPPQHLA